MNSFVYSSVTSEVAGVHSATMKSESTMLPDDIISYIFSKLSLKNLVKTNVLSKQWFKEWVLRKDLTFDLHNMFDYDTIPELPITLPLFQQLQSQFATRLDNFMQKYPGDIISSIRVNFPLGVDHTYAIDGLIHKGVLKGANRIELLFAYETDFKIEPYQFLFPFVSGNNSLTYLHLQNCRIAALTKFSGLKNLKTLVLHLVPVEQNMLRDLFLNCVHLENFTLKECPFLSDLKITSSTLLHLNINCGLVIKKIIKIDIIASNLLSIEYSSEFYCKQNCHIAALTKFSGLKNLKTLVLHLVPVEQNMLRDLFLNCVHLENFTLKECQFLSHLKITSPTLLHLNINCGLVIKMIINIDIIASNLLSIEYSSKFYCILHKLSIDSPMLSKLTYRCAKIFNPNFSRLTNVTTIVLDGLRANGDVITHFFSKFLQLEDITFNRCLFTGDLKIISTKLRHLSIVQCRHRIYHPCKVDIDALNLSSFEFRGNKDMRSIISVEAPKLLKVFWDAGFNKINIDNFATTAKITSA